VPDVNLVWVDLPAGLAVSLRGMRFPVPQETTVSLKTSPLA
jgi:hypothetical protein